MKTKVFFLTLLTGALVTLTFGCKPLISPDKVSQPQPQPREVQQAPVKPSTPVNLEVYFPATVGSVWQYQGEGNEYATFQRKVLFREGNRAQLQDDNGGTLHDNITEFRPEGLVRTFNQASTGQTKNLLATSPTEQTYLLITPLQVGTKWNVPEGLREVVDVNATVATPAGTFHKCIQVQITSQDSVVNEYYASGIGLVKQDYQAGDQVVTSLLAQYSIK